MFFLGPQGKENPIYHLSFEVYILSNPKQQFSLTELETCQLSLLCNFQAHQVDMFCHKADNKSMIILILFI